MTQSTDLTLTFDSAELANQLFGPQNANLALLAERAGLKIASRGLTVTIEGEERAAEIMGQTLTQLYGLLKAGTALHPRDVALSWDMMRRNSSTDLRKIFQDVVFVVSPRKTITPKTLSQREYVGALRSTDMTFGIGPAGTGKTYLAVAMALSMLSSKRVKRIILTRPAVEAGERLGFLPGDLTQKVDPYLRPLYDALHDMLDFERVQEMMDTGVIEIAPLAFMRGRTLNDAYVILDEAQNTTPEQMKMFLTRMGYGTKIAVTGDITQIDLPENGAKQRSGLVQALDVLDGVEGISIVRFHKDDVVRHPLVGRIVEAYEEYPKHTR